MSQPADLTQQINALSQLLHEKTGVSGRTFAARAHRARFRLPRAARRQARIIADAESRLDNPHLQVTLSDPGLDRAMIRLKDHLMSIDPIDRRRGWWLGMLGGMVFNLLLATVLGVALLRFFGLI
ncbi:MAG: hypothetical protein ACWA5A_14685 [Marinibacterium sp.]